MSVLTCYSLCRKRTSLLRAFVLVGCMGMSLVCMNAAHAEDELPADVEVAQAEATLEAEVEATPEAEANVALEADDTLEAEAEAVDPNGRPESKSISAVYLKNFDITKQRNPFGEMQEAPKETMHTDPSWWEDSDEEAPQQVAGELYFNGGVGSTASFARLPSIKVTGMMQIGGRSAVTAIIQNRGSCVLYENDRLVLNSGGGKSNLTKWLFIKKIHSNGMTIILDDGKEISGKFY